MRAKIPDGVADLVYLDPPFNSARSYNLLFKRVKGDASPAQIMAFEDTWSWSPRLYQDFRDDRRNSPLWELMDSLKQFVGESEMMAYLLMMAPRLLELHRKLKPTGSLYLHCDPVASHYLKVLLDVVFGPENFKNEIVWERTNAHNFKTKRYGRMHDTLLYYVKSKNYTWNPQYSEYPEAQLKRYRPDETGRLYTGQDLTMVGSSPQRKEMWRGSQPASNRVWGMSLEERERLYAEGLILLQKDGTPRLDG